MKFSIIIPLYNRPQELDELLDTLTRQTCKNFEVVIVEDGSTIKGDEIAEKYSTELDIKYFEKENEGPGLTRNYGAERATGDFFVFFDSDCLIPENYLKTVIQHLEKNPVDCYGGPDRAHESFTNLQKAINYTMTSFFTTGGIRGSKNTVEKFHPRTFNIGFSKQLFQETGGFSSLRISEDIEFSKRITSLGYTTGLIPEAFVYHKRRT
ncbi:MAG: glycosyltransferase, partial [Bacteroidota bacterium]